MQLMMMMLLRLMMMMVPLVPSPSEAARSWSRVGGGGGGGGGRGRVVVQARLPSSSSSSSSSSSASGCAGRWVPRCCPDRDPDCFGYGKRGGRCYCDAACAATGDCCEDYRRVCNIAATDCAVLGWGAWSPCSSACGVGSRERIRQVTVPPHNGGAKCPHLRQRQGCYSHSLQLCQGIREVAQLLPNYYTRSTNDPWKRPHMMKNEPATSSCVFFRVDDASSPCASRSAVAPWLRLLQAGRRVCVECQGEAVRRGEGRCSGDGVQGTRTFWAAVSVPGCRGSWLRERHHNDCHCPPHSSLLFV
uniref:Somatomedin-B and thrombospondin type-1 domain-containing protein-like n=1 Tax=Petromyzon marinus TaxID=7757 RepID=A0AAJ7TW27_PETMA|nr:somatomedin-B and thrombospondin type-1 domain-containing protein-like [Petromyzon marinus]